MLDRSWGWLGGGNRGSTAATKRRIEGRAEVDNKVGEKHEARGGGGRKATEESTPEKREPLAEVQEKYMTWTVSVSSSPSWPEPLANPYHGAERAP